MPSLWKLTGEYRLAMESIGESENPEEDFLALEAIEAGLEAKVENVAKYILDLDADAKKLKEEEARLVEHFRAQRTPIEGKASRLRAYLLKSMGDTGRDKITHGGVGVSLRKCPASCDVAVGASIPYAFLRVIPERYEPDKKALIAHYKATGEIHEGVTYITDKRTVQIK